MDLPPTETARPLPFWEGAVIDPARMQPLPALPYGYPDGWMGRLDLCHLYNLALALPGPILEVGPWLGRSTSAICAGIRDARRTQRTLFDIVDFGPTSPAEWHRLFGKPFNAAMANGIAADAIHHPGGSLAVLIQNLKRNGLLDQATTITRGNFLDMPFSRHYGLIFCDTTHDAREVDLYLPRPAELLLPGAVLVFDDVLDEALAERILGHLPVRKACRLRTIDERAKQLAVQAL
jgi:predicted O-methyltransferase YrrM